MTDRYAVVGNPVSHSKSPRIHAAFARATGQDLSYAALLAPLDGFVATVEDFRAEGGRGLNVTVPFKLEAHEYADRMSGRARLAGAVNTLKFEDDGAVSGDNTDGVGLVRDLTANLGVALAGRDVLLLGAGGAARGVLGPLLEAGAQVTLANRTAATATELARAFARQGEVRGGGFDSVRGGYALVVNATAASLQGEVPPLPEGVFGPGALAYDMMYGAEPTAFLRWASAHGAARVADGLGMLVEQAAESFLVWRGLRPATAAVLAELRTALAV